MCMPKTDHADTSDTHICVDKMKLTVGNSYPDFQDKSEHETRQETGAQLYRIFKKYA